VNFAGEAEKRSLSEKLSTVRDRLTLLGFAVQSCQQDSYQLCN